MREDEFTRLVEYGERRNALQAAWYRQLLMLASGGFALLVGLRPQAEPESIGRYLLAAAWVCLGSGILSGAAATWQEVSLAKRLTRRYWEALRQSVRDGTAITTPVVERGGWIFRMSKYVMVISLLLAVVAFVGYGVISALEVV